MSELKFNNLQPSGSQLFADPESFLADLSPDEIEVVHGGRRHRTTAQVTTKTQTETIFYQPTGTYATVPGGNSGINCTNFYTGGITTIPGQTHFPRTPPMMTPPVKLPPMMTVATTAADLSNG
jgi:hypothetical protein